MLNYCQTAKTKTGQSSFAVGMQNEVAMKPEFVEPFLIALRKPLDDHDFKEVKINGATIQSTISRLELYRNNPAVWDKVEFPASNLYDIQQFFRNPDKLDTLLKHWRDLIGNRFFMGTELCINNSCQDEGYLLALTCGQYSHKPLTLIDALWISYCWTRLNVEQLNYAMTRSLFGIDRSNAFIPKASSRQLRVYGVCSRHIRRDMVRVETVSADANLLVTAFQGGNGHAVLVLLNRGTSPVKPQLDWPGVRFSQR